MISFFFGNFIYSYNVFQSFFSVLVLLIPLPTLSITPPSLPVTFPLSCLLWPISFNQGHLQDWIRTLRWCPGRSPVGAQLRAMARFLLDLSVANSSSVRGRALGSCFFVLTQLLICPDLASPRASICSCSEFMIAMSLSYPDGGISWPFYPSSDSCTLSTTPSSGFLGPESRW